MDLADGTKWFVVMLSKSESECTKSVGYDPIEGGTKNWQLQNLTRTMLD